MIDRRRILLISVAIVVIITSALAFVITIPAGSRSHVTKPSTALGPGSVPTTATAPRSNQNPATTVTTVTQHTHPSPTPVGATGASGSTPTPTTPPPDPGPVQSHFSPVARDWSASSASGYPTGSGPCTSCGALNLTWQGGPVQEQPTAYAIFWGSHWQNQGSPSSDAQLVESYFQDVGGTAFANILTQYHDVNAHISNDLHFGGAWFDTSAPPTDFSCLLPTVEDTAIQSEVVSAIATNGWPVSGNATYFVYTPPGTVVNSASAGGCPVHLYIKSKSVTQTCGYHFYLSSLGVAYATIMYPGQLSLCRVPTSPNGDIAAESMISITSHEQFEAITDPQILSVDGHLSANGWFDSGGEEIGDKCAWNFSAGLTHLNNGGVFEIQTEFSNATSSCVNAYTPTALYVAASTGLNAFDPTSGALMWRYLTPCNVSAPVVASGTVYVSACATLYAVSANSPSLLWSHLFPSGISNPPVFAYGIVYVTTNDNTLTALNATTGATLWSFQDPDGGFKQILVGDDGEIFALVSPPYNGHLLALSTSTGALLWQDTFNNDWIGSMAYANGIVYAGTTLSFCTTVPCGALQAFDAAKGYQIWSQSIWNFLTPTVANGVIYVPGGGTLNAYDANVGTPLWYANVSSANIANSPVVANGTIYMGLSDGHVAAINANDGSPKWQYLTGGNVQSSPLVVNGVVYAGSGDTYAYALDANAGTLLWHTATAAGISSSPALASAHLAVKSPSMVARAAPGGEPATQTITISDSGLLSTNWTLSASPPSWLSISKSSGTIAPGASQNITAKFTLPNPSQVQSLNTTLTFQDSGADNGSVQVTITAVIGPLNTLYVAVGRALDAFDPTSGVLMWRYMAPCGVSAPAVASGTVYVVACDTLYAVSASAPTLLWSYQFPSSTSNPPVFAYGVVYVSTNDNTLTALNATTGAVLWSFHDPDGGVKQILVGDDGEVFLLVSPPYNGHLLALNTSTGALLWQNTFNNDWIGSMAYANGIVYAGTTFAFCTTVPCGALQAFAATTGFFIWRQSIWNFLTPTVANGVIYVPGGSTLNAYDANVGAALWNVTPSSANINNSPPVVNGIAYLSMSDGNVIALNLSNQTIAWQTTVGTAQLSTAVIGDNAAFVVGNDSSVRALNLVTGAVLWHTTLAGGSQATPALG